MYLYIKVSQNIRKIAHWKIAPKKITHQKIAYQKVTPYENTRPTPLPMKAPPEKITPHEIPSPLINHINVRKNKIAKLFALQKAVQRNILIKITKVLFDTQIISYKILGLDTFFTE